MNGLARLAVVALLSAASVAACGAEVAPPTRRPTPVDVQATLDWMLERTMACVEQPTAAGSRSWVCLGQSGNADGSLDSLRVTIERSDAGRTHLVAVLDATASIGVDPCPGLICDPYTGFFADTIALSPLLGDAGNEVGSWVEAHARGGGQQGFGPIRVDYRPIKPMFTMTVDIEASSST